MESGCWVSGIACLPFETQNAPITSVKVAAPQNRGGPGLVTIDVRREFQKEADVQIDSSLTSSPSALDPAEQQLVSRSWTVRHALVHRCARPQYPGVFRV